MSASLPFRSRRPESISIANAGALYERAYGLEDLQPHSSAWKREKAARERRLTLNSRLGEIDSILATAPFKGGGENRLVIRTQGKSGHPPISLDARKARIRKERKQLEKERKDILLRLEHEFRKELECPYVTRDLSRSAFHVYLQLAQYEGLAARGRVYTFTLEGRKLTNRQHYLKKLRNAGWIVIGVIGCAMLESGRRHPHLHCLAILPEGATLPAKHGKKLEAASPEHLPELLDGGVTILPLTAETETKTEAAGLAKGFLAFCLYLAENYEQPMPAKLKKLYRIRHIPDRRVGIKLTKVQKSNLHPYRTRGELELFRRVFPRGRSGVGARRAFWRAGPLPDYHYPAEAVLRDGFSYVLRPDWGYQLNYLGVISVPCDYERRGVGSTPHAGECELDILLAASRFRRIIPRDSSPWCRPTAYTSYDGRVRPVAA